MNFEISKEAHYKASFIKRKTLNGLPFEHYVQDEVMKTKTRHCQNTLRAK